MALPANTKAAPREMSNKKRGGQGIYIPWHASPYETFLRASILADDSGVPRHGQKQTKASKTPSRVGDVVIEPGRTDLTHAGRRNRAEVHLAVLVHQPIGREGELPDREVKAVPDLRPRTSPGPTTWYAREGSVEGGDRVTTEASGAVLDMALYPL